MESGWLTRGSSRTFKLYNDMIRLNYALNISSFILVFGHVKCGTVGHCVMSRTLQVQKETLRVRGV